MINND